MFIEKKRKVPVIEIIIASFVYLFHYTGLIDITIKGASPVILLPITVAVAMFYSELTGLLFGLCCGFAMDAVAASTSVFNTIAFMLIGFIAGLLAKRIFNRNLPAAIALTLISETGYFGIKWLISAIIPDVQGKVYYLLWNLTPCAVYTLIFIIPLYFLEKRLHKQKN
jgi:rod shape-determining protein MreD